MRASLIATACVALAVSNVHAQQLAVRHGLTGGFLAGGGHNFPRRCVSVAGDCADTAMIDIHAGWMFRPDLAAVGRLAVLGGGQLPDTGFLGGSLRYWPARRIWFSAGFGVGELAIGDDASGVLSGAVGVEVVRRTHLAIGAQTEWLVARTTSDQWTHNISLGLTLDWHDIR